MGSLVIFVIVILLIWLALVKVVIPAIEILEEKEEIVERKRKAIEDARRAKEASDWQEQMRYEATARVDTTSLISFLKAF